MSDSPAAPSTRSSNLRGLAYIGAGAAVGIAFGVGFAIGDTDPTGSDAYKTIATELSTTKDSLTTAQAAALKAQNELGTIPGREAAVAEKEADLKEREAAVKADERDVRDREKAVGIVEREIERNTIGEGVYEVGVDMKPGTYKTAGADSCYYAVLGDANGNDIRSNNNTNGPAVVTVSRGQFFQSIRCADWVLQR